MKFELLLRPQKKLFLNLLFPQFVEVGASDRRFGRRILGSTERRSLRRRRHSLRQRNRRVRVDAERPRSNFGRIRSVILSFDQTFLMRTF